MPATRLTIFISSVQKEFADERRAVRDFISGNRLLSRHFDVFLFEDLPARDRRPDQLYIEKVDESSVFVSLLGEDYGWEDPKDGVSPVEREFDRAAEAGKHRLLFLKNLGKTTPHPKMAALTARAKEQLKYQRFDDVGDLAASLYDSLVEQLEERGVIQDKPFDAAVQVSVFADRIEVWNPGRLPAGLTPEDLGKPHSSEPANPLIAHPLYLAHYIESLGTGTIDVIRLCHESNLPAPQFEQRGSQFVVTVWRDWLTSEAMAELRLNSRQQQALAHLKTHSRITNSDYQEAMGVSRATATRDLDVLVARGVLERVGTTGKGTHYVLTRKRLT